MYCVNAVLYSRVHFTQADRSSVHVGHRFANRVSGVFTGASQGQGDIDNHWIPLMNACQQSYGPAPNAVSPHPSNHGHVRQHSRV